MSKNLHVQRHELKFYINQNEYLYLKNILKHLAKNDEFQGDKEKYLIRSLYFDDIHDSSVEEKLDGIELRDKYRLRIYDPNQDWAKLEQKRKLNNYVQKTSLLISKSEAKQLLNRDYKFLLNKNNPNSRKFYFYFNQKYLKPVLLVDYYRDAYKLNYNNIRITFDTNLRINQNHFELFSDKVQTTPIQNSTNIILEVKYNHHLPSWFKDFIHLKSKTQTAISKYCHGRLLTNEFYK